MIVSCFCLQGEDSKLMVSVLCLHFGTQEEDILEHTNVGANGLLWLEGATLRGSLLANDGI